MNKVHLVLFYTQGSPFDLGLDLEKEAQLVYRQAIGLFDSVQMYTPKKCKNIFKDHESIFADRLDWVVQQSINMKEKFNWSENWAAINFLLWKPALINYIINDCEDISNEDIIFYHDVNVTRYPEYLIGVEKWKSYVIKEMENKSVLLFTDYRMKLSHDIKRELLQRASLWGGQETRQPHLWAGAMAFRKDFYAQQFVAEWLSMCNDLKNISPVTRYQNTKNFIKHSQEQACLSVLYYSRYKPDRAIRLKYLLESRSIPPTLSTKIRFPYRIISRFFKERFLWPN